MPQGRRSCLALGLLAALLALPAVFGVKDTKFYKVLDVDPSADEATIKKAYKKQALKWHPDRNTDNKEEATNRFAEVATAHETLTDPEKRKLYDQFGEEGPQQGPPRGHHGGMGFPGGGGGIDPHVLFETIFGGGGGGMGGGMPGGMHMGGMGGGMPGMGMGGMGMGGMGGGRQRQQQRQRPPQGESLYGNDDVVEVTQGTFPGRKDASVWLMEFYAPWCGHCRNLAGKWKKVASALKGSVKVGAVNCDAHAALCQAHGVQGYPTIKSVVGGRVRDYNGERSASALKSFALSLLPDAATVLARQGDLSAFLSKASAKGGASSGACAVLVTDKASTPSVFKALAAEFGERLGFAAARKGAVELVSELGLSRAPSLAVVCNGDTGTVDLYTGEMKAEPLRQYLAGFADGKKCGGMVRIDAGTDLKSWRVGKLKQVMQTRGWSCQGCVEKDDFISSIQSHLGLVSG